MSTVLKLPHWDMTPVYPGLESVEFEQGFRSIVKEIDQLRSLFNNNQVDRQTSVPVDDDFVKQFEEVASALNDVTDRLLVITAYIRSFIATDSFNDLAQARASELQPYAVTLDQLTTRFTAWVGSLDVDVLVARSPMARAHAFPLRKMKTAAAHQMEPSQEDLAAELSMSGGLAWSKLYGTVTSQLKVPVEVDGETRELPMSVVRNMAHDPDREVRRKGREAEIEAWKGVAVPLAAAMNSIKGETNTVQLRRGWDSALEVALFINNIDKKTLDAMFEAVRRSFPDFRRYLRIKARGLGLEKLTWYDIFAPMGRSSRKWEYGEAESFLIEQFGTYSDRLKVLAERAFHEKWIDAEPRTGKVQGAFCMALRADESRILANYNSSYDSVKTLAHELGHAYHNVCLSGRTRLQRQNPMTLAETASIFNETIIMHAALEGADRLEQIAIIQGALQSQCQVVVDISSRFLFEKGVFEARRERELSIDELCERMVDAQRETYGDGLDQSILHPYMWAAKSHYYGPGRPFYNFPYMFGLLFGLGLYARYQRDPEAFKSAYDEFLSMTGLEDAATLASRFDIDLRTTDFWNDSLDIIRANIDRLDSLVSHDPAA
jgi:oligoendopeptidase F